MKQRHRACATGLSSFLAAAVFCAPAVLAASTEPASVKIVENEIAGSLTGKQGDATNGKRLFADRKLGNCLACHANKDLAEQPFHGEVGPPIDGVAERYTDGQLRAILVDSKAVFGKQTIMPGFYRPDAGARIAKKFMGKTILSAEQVEDVLAYLKTLKE